MSIPPRLQIKRGGEKEEEERLEKSVKCLELVYWCWCWGRREKDAIAFFFVVVCGGRERW